MAIVLVAAGALAHSSSFRGVFVLDDLRAIVQNPTITSLSTALRPPPASTVSGRPVANLTLAINYALAPRNVRDVFVVGGTGPRSGSSADFLRNIRGYHAMNLAIHLAAGLLLFGCVRRTLNSARVAPVVREHATWLAFVIALVWLVHPLQTESVTYVVQRVESLMGLFYLLMMYCAIRAADESGRPGVRASGRHTASASENSGESTSRHPDVRPSARIPAAAWTAAAIVACALGMGTKEAMVTAPLAVALWDWTFAPRARPIRWRFWASLAATWVVLAVLLWNEHRAPSIDAGQQTAVRYLFTQAAIVLHYVRLSFVPSPLIFLYTWPLVPSLWHVAPQVAVAGALVVLTLVGVARRSALAFASMWFFLILAPTSSLLPIVTEVAAEHRMYLPLASIVACATLAVFLLGRHVLRRLFPATQTSSRTTSVRVIAAIVTILVAGAYGAQTYARNQVYWSDIGLWRDVVEKQPDNQRARVLYGVALIGAERFAEAETQLQAAFRLAPSDPVALGRLGLAQASQGKLNAAVESWERAAALAPQDIVIQRYLGEAYRRQHDDARAIVHLERVLEAHPDDVMVLVQAATLRADSNDFSVRNPERAAALARRASELTGRRNPLVLNVLAAAQANAGQYAAAAATAREALQLARMQGNAALASELELRVSAYQSRVQ